MYVRFETKGYSNYQGFEFRYHALLPTSDPPFDIPSGQLVSDDQITSKTAKLSSFVFQRHKFNHYTSEVFLK